MTNTYEISRVPLGKLPTDFTRPTSCNTPWIDSYFIDYAVSCTTTSGKEPHVEDDTACYPSGNVGGFPLDVSFFSPASVCPQGFTSACNVTKTVFDPGVQSITFGAAVTEELRFVLEDGETAIACCPIGYECDSRSAQSCSSIISPGQTVSGLTYGRSCSSEPTTTVIPASSDIFFTTEAASQFNVWLVHDPGKDRAGASSPSSGGLSTGAKIGLGVGIPLGLIALAVIIFIYCHRRRKLETERQRQKQRQTQKPDDEPALPPHLEKPELQGSEGAAVAGPGRKTITQKPELDTKTATSTGAVNKDLKSPELDASQTGTGARHELHSPASATITNFAEFSSDPYRYELDAGDDVRWKSREV